MDNTQKDKYQKEWRNIGYFGACADIANSSKHFGLDFGKVSSVANVNEYTEQLVAIGPDGKLVPSLVSEKPFFKITLDNGKEIDLLALLLMTCKDWKEQFHEHAITTETLPELGEIFLE